MDEMASLVKQSANGALQAAQACKDLSRLASDLQNIVSGFRLSAEKETEKAGVGDTSLLGLKTTRQRSRSMSAGAR
jgi:hypothetical protein